MMPNGYRRKRGFKQGSGFEHDDRMPPGGGNARMPPGGAGVLRRVSFKNNSGGGGGGKFNRQKGWDNKVRAAFMDEDIDMAGSQQHHPNQRRPDKWSGGRQDPHFSRKQRYRRLTESPSYWYRVHIKNGQKYDKQHLLKLINNFIKPIPFDPIGYSVTNEEATFIVGEFKMAEAIMMASNKITLNDGWKLSMRVRPITPIIEVDDGMTAAIKEALGGRFNSVLKSLNLTSFHRDNAFMKRSMFCPLNRPNIMTAVINIVGESAPDLQALDLSENKINATEHMKIMIEKIPHLKTLHIGKNKLRDIKALNPLKGLPITELVLDENGLCDRYKDRDAYIRAVRDVFPKVIKLDQVDLPPPILFVDEEVAQLPPVQASFMCDATGGPIVRQFLEQYYLLYDENDRSQIAQAYHENAEFSMCIATDPNPPSYVSDNRNLLKWPQTDRRVRTLKKGRYNIVNFLNSLPTTQHDPSSFAVDLIVFSPQVIQISVMGVFKDKDRNKQPIRAFSRVFIIVPIGPGFCITNEMLSISPANPDQIKKAFKPVDVLPELVASGMANINIAPAEPDIVTKQQMVANLSMKTGMNILWSEKCLTETNWNYDRAEFAFGELHKAGTIPPEAFIK